MLSALKSRMLALEFAGRVRWLLAMARRQGIIFRERFFYVRRNQSVCADCVNLLAMPGIHIFLEGTRVMKGKELLRVSVLGNLAVLRHRTRMRLPPS